MVKSYSVKKGSKQSSGPKKNFANIYNYIYSSMQSQWDYAIQSSSKTIKDAIVYYSTCSLIIFI